MTIFCHGTSSYSDEKALNPKNGRECGELERELVWVLEKNYRIPDNLQSETFNGGKLLLQGVGSVNDPTANHIKVIGDELKAVRSRIPPNRLFNMLSGRGVGRNISTAITFLEYMVGHGLVPNKINMVGWSRGGVTCVRLAQALHANATLKKIEVNIFAGDPVPGATRHNTWTLTRSKNYAITPNVYRYLQVLAMHVDDWKAGLFRPLRPVAEDKEHTKVGVLPIPGSHSQVVKAGLVPTGNASPGAITIDMAIRFLLMCGSEGVSATGMTDLKLRYETILSYYDQIHSAVRVGDGSYGKHMELSLYAAMRSMVRYKRKTDAKALELPYMSGGYVNDHHQLLDKRISREPISHIIDAQLKDMLVAMYP